MTGVIAEDRRVRRSKAALRAAMVELVLEQGYESVSIDALAERADITRATFYAHFANKGELLTAVVEEFADEVTAAFADPDVAARHAGRLELLLDRARASRDVLRIIVRGEGDGGPLRRFTERVSEVVAEDLHQRIAEAGATPRVRPELITAMRTANVMAAVAWFIEQGAGVRAADVAIDVSQATDLGCAWAAGVDAS